MHRDPERGCGQHQQIMLSAEGVLTPYMNVRFRLLVAAMLDSGVRRHDAR